MTETDSIETTECKPIGAADLSLPILLSGLLLLPDLSELSIANLVVLKRKVEKQDGEIATNARRLQELQGMISFHQVQAISTNIVSSASVDLTVINQGVMSAKSKSGELEEFEIPKLEESQDVSNLVQLGDKVLSIVPEEVGEENRTLAADFARQFTHEIGTVRESRNAAIAGLLTTREISAASELSTILLRTWSKRTDTSS